jgi:hypothetical protein
MDIASLRAKLDNIAEELAQLPEQESVAIEEETIEEAHMMPKTLKCKECGDMLGNPTTDCPCDSMDPKGDNWIMVDVDNDGDMDMAMANEEDLSEFSPADMKAADKDNKAIQKSGSGMKSTSAAKPQNAGTLAQRLKTEEIEEVEEGFAVGASVAPSEEGPDQAPGKVVAVDGDKVTVKFMDGSTEVFAQDELFALPAGLKVGEEVAEEAVEEATVEVPVQELADLMQLAGYANYADKIEEYANEPEEEYQDAEDQLIGLSGGLNGPKNMHTPAAGGDNPMDKEALKTVEESLYKSYKDFLEEADIKKED